jgi:hypothetical protein
MEGSATFAPLILRGMLAEHGALLGRVHGMDFVLEFWQYLVIKVFTIVLVLPYIVVLRIAFMAPLNHFDYRQCYSYITS